MHNLSSSKTSTFSSFLGTFSNFAPAFFTQFMTETWLTLSIPSSLLKPLPPEHLYRFSLDIFWVAALAYRVVASTFGHLSSLSIHSFYTVYRFLATSDKPGVPQVSIFHWLSCRPGPRGQRKYYFLCSPALNVLSAGLAEDPQGLRFFAAARCSIRALPTNHPLDFLLNF